MCIRDRCPSERTSARAASRRTSQLCRGLLACESRNSAGTAAFASCPRWDRASVRGPTCAVPPVPPASPGLHRARRHAKFRGHACTPPKDGALKKLNCTTTLAGAPPGPLELRQKCRPYSHGERLTDVARVRVAGVATCSPRRALREHRDATTVVSTSSTARTGAAAAAQRRAACGGRGGRAAVAPRPLPHASRRHARVRRVRRR